MYNNKGLNLKN